ncbi:TPA: glycosyltransferase [Vibrio parahaemolyticus]|nr:glycosyltransferase [Vibrio parahaemolyticus]
MLTKNKIQIVGAIPDPIGGVSTFIYRLSYMLSKTDINHSIIDLYPSDKKLKIPSRMYVAPRKFLFSRVSFLKRKISKSPDNIVFYNFSSIKSLFIFVFIKKHEEHWVLMLHNGDLHFSKKMTILWKYIYRLIVKKIDKVLYISERQRDFYLKELKLDSDTLESVKSYIPASVVCEKEETELCKGLKNIILANGYIKSLYNFEFLIKLARKYQDYNIVIVTYGEAEPGYHDYIMNLCDGLDNIHFLEQVSPVAFVSLLSRSCLYARPNHIDSFGIAVADAISLGVPVVASNVCERTRGAIIFDPNDFDDFLVAFEKALCRESTKAVTSIANVQKEFINKIGL